MPSDSAAHAAAARYISTFQGQAGRTVLALGGCLFLAAAVALFWPGLAAAAAAWQRPEYSYGYLVAPIAAYLLWLRLPAALAVSVRYRAAGVVLVALAALLGVVGALSRIADLSGYGFILALTGGFIAVLGVPATLRLWAPLAYLAFMLPLPQLVYLKLSATMQLLSSELGVEMVRLLGVSVLLEGNIIDLGTYKLQVAEACSGLRYFFPLMGFGFLFAALYRGPAWQKWMLFLSTIPITIAMNSIRIAAIGMLVTYFGIEQAEGFLHAFEGWVIFLACIALLFGETLLLMRLLRTRRPLRDMLDVSGPPPNLRALSHERAWAGPLASATGLLIAGAVTLGAATLANDANAVPPRLDLIQFPTSIQGWRGEQTGLSSEVLRVLAADDYVLATYKPTEGGGEAVNLFIAYYANQTDGRAVHSPEVCLPGDGWETTSFTTVQVQPAAGAVMPVNRAVIQKGLSRALVYYWFDGRGRRVTNEYLAKWYILWDGIMRRRTDGALVRLVTPLAGAGDEAAADARLLRFLDSVEPKFAVHVPH